MYRVKIKKLPTAQYGRSKKTGQQSTDGALSIQPTAMGGADIDQYMGKQPTEVKDTISRVPRKDANLEAEGGETVYGDINGDGFAEHYKITGPRHSSGGVPLNLPDDTFIFSDTKSMKISDPQLLAKFGKTSGSYTPADLAKPYDINHYRKILQDPDSDTIDKKTAEMMIRTYNMKLGALALAQEAKKGFPQGIPLVAKPYMEANGITEEDIMPTYQPKFSEQGEGDEDTEFEEMPMNGTAPEQPSMEENTVPGYGGPNPEDIAMTEEMMQNAPMAQYGMSMGNYYTPSFMAGGYIPQAQEGITINPYESAKTAKGNVTPTGKSNKYSTRDQDIKDYLSEWENDIPGISKMSEGKAQAAIYDWNLANNPDAIKAMWKEFGLTKEGEKYPKLVKLTNNGVLKDEALDDPEALKELKKAYVDNYFGARQIAPKKAVVAEKKTEPKTTVTVTKCKCIDKEGKSYDPGKDENGNCNECKETERPELEDVEVDPETGVVVPEWTTPDLMNYYGAFKDKYSLNKYYPWASPVDMEEMPGVYLDPTRDLAAQSEQANIMTNALAQFTGPQQASSRLSNIQGQGARQAADTLSRYNNANVQLANQIGSQNAQIRNQERAANQAISKQLYDQTTLTNATFDRDRRLADNVNRQAFATGWKNASDIAMLNATSPQYEIDPRTGTVVFERGKPLKPEVNRTFDNLLKGYIERGFEPKDAIAAAKIAMGQESSYTGLDLAKKGLIVTGPMLYPFVL
jgi:hypothetical protein